jgi:hypothetical protein
MSYTMKCDDGDLIMDSTGRYRAVFGQEKCVQDIAESLLNNYDTEFPMYYNGSLLYEIDHNPAFVEAIGAEAFIHAAVNESIERLMDSQENDEYVDAAEKINHIQQLMVRRLGIMTYTFYLLAITEDDSDVTVDDFVVSLAQQLPASLAQGYSNFLPAGQTTDSQPFV